MAAVKAADVERAVLGRPAHVAVLLFYGPDAGRIAGQARAAARAFVTDPEDSFQLIRLDGDSLADQPGRLVEEATTFGMFGSRRSLWVRPSARSLAPAVAPCLDADLADTLVVVEGGDLARNAPLRTLCEGSPKAYALPCYADEARDLGTLITETLRRDGLAIDRDARQMLAEQLGGDRLASLGEIEKLALFAHGQTVVTAEDVEAVVSDVSGLAIDSVLDAAFGGQAGELEAGLARLARHNVAAATLGILALRHGLTLLAVRTRVEEGGESVEDALRSWRGMHFRRRDAITRQARRWSARELAAAVSDIQAATKGGRRAALIADQLTSGSLLRVAARAAALR